MTWLRITLLRLKSALSPPADLSANRLRIDAHAICQTTL